MLAEKPNLQLIQTQCVADREIVCTVVSDGGSPFRKSSAIPDDDLMRIQQARDLYRNLFPALGWPFDLRRLRHVVSHGDAEAAEQLNPFGDGIHKLRLLAEMLVKK